VPRPGEWEQDWHSRQKMIGAEGPGSEHQSMAYAILRKVTSDVDLSPEL